MRTPQPNLPLHTFLYLLVTLVLSACATRELPRTEAQRFHLGDHVFPISTSSPEAQAAFNRGLTLAYAFSHRAAEAEFRKAAAHDPQAAMPWWGVALVNGPHINYPLVPEDKATTAWEALTRAEALSGTTSALEKDLIAALAKRYANPQPEDRSGLDRAYAAAMEKVWAKYSGNADVATLFAESLMDLHPWDLYLLDGSAKPWTPKIVMTLERALELHPRHPGAHHLYIHAVEASDTPERGIYSADTLGSLVPGAGHLVHMPAHIYLRVGRLEDAARSNEEAVLADKYFRRANPRPGFYAVYMLHNNHFLSFVRMMQGRKEPALRAARAMIAGVPPDFLKDFGPVADGYLAIALEVLVRFGRWEEVLQEPEPADTMPIARAMWHFSRATALNALDRPTEAAAEYDLFIAASKRVPDGATFGNNDAAKLLTIARHVLDGEMAARESHFDAAIRSLETAKELEDTLRYDEPPDWLLPVRHSLGAALIKATRYEEAERVYREDQKKFPGNAWSLYGLSRALELQGKDKEAAAVLKEFKAVGADANITSSCLCLA